MFEKSTTSQIAAAFFDKPTTALYAADIARATGFSRAAVLDHLTVLQKAGLILRIEEQRGSRTYPKYLAHRESLAFRRAKMLANIAALWPLTDYLIEQYKPTALVLFGSYRRGEDIEGSDIDIFLETSATAPQAAQFEKQLGRTVSFYAAPSFSAITGELKNNLINGIVLYGYIELV